MEALETNKESLEYKDMKKLSRGEMIEMLLLQSEEIDKNKKEIEELKSKLEDRTIAIDKAGTLAEASILISNILHEADNAAKDYLYNIEKLSGDVERVSQAKLAEVNLKADEQLLNAKEKASEIVSKAQQEADAIVSKAAVQRDRIRREADGYWTEVSMKMEAFYREHKGLREMLNSFGGPLDK